MEIEFDPVKSARNANLRRLSFERAVDFDFKTAFIREDIRHDYPERRFVAIGFLGDRPHVLVFSPKKAGIRVISFRKANRREVRDHEQTIASLD
jgi:uncharacterized DUF497 family protein